MTSTVRRFASLALLFVAFLCACDVEIQEQEMKWRYDAQKDELHVLFVHRGVGSPEPKKGAERIVELLAGRRTFMLVDWPLLVDLDEKTNDGAKSPLYASARANVVLDHVHAGVGRSGWIDGTQAVRIQLWSRFLRDVNSAIASTVRAEFALGASSEFAKLDPETQRLWRERAVANGSWLGWDERGLYFDVPASPRGLVQFQRMLLEHFAGESDGDTETLFALFDSTFHAFEPIENGVRIRLGTPADGSWSLRAKRGEPAKGLAELRGSLADAGIVLAPFDEQRSIDEWLGRAAPAQR